MKILKNPQKIPKNDKNFGDIPKSPKSFKSPNLTLFGDEIPKLATLFFLLKIIGTMQTFRCSCEYIPEKINRYFITSESIYLL